jgi:hypothetical protein
MSFTCQVENKRVNEVTSYQKATSKNTDRGVYGGPVSTTPKMAPP